MDGRPWLAVGERKLRAPLILGIEQYTSAELVGDVLRAGGCDVFITTFDLQGGRPSLLLCDLDASMDLDAFTWVGTTSFATSREEALRTAGLLRDHLDIDIIKLDVRPRHNLPDNAETVKAAQELVDDGYTVLPFITPDAADARDLAALGCAAIRVMASPVASGRGIDCPRLVREVIDAVDVPVIVEGGLGTPAQVAAAMAMGATAVLVNTAVASAADPVAMARAMRAAAVSVAEPSR